MANQLESEVVELLTQLFPGAAQIFKEQLARQIKIQGGFKKPKMNSWADDIANAFELQPVKYSHGVLTGRLELPSGNNEARAMVMMHGNPGIGNPPMTKPGEKTWDGNMEEQSVHVGSDQQPELMPDKFLHGPKIEKDFIDNTARKCDQKISDYFVGQTVAIAGFINKVVKDLAGSV